MSLFKMRRGSASKKAVVMKQRSQSTRKAAALLMSLIASIALIVPASAASNSLPRGGSMQVGNILYNNVATHNVYQGSINSSGFFEIWHKYRNNNDPNEPLNGFQCLSSNQYYGVKGTYASNGSKFAIYNSSNVALKSWAGNWTGSSYQGTTVDISNTGYLYVGYAAYRDQTC